MAHDYSNRASNAYTFTIPRLHAISGYKATPAIQAVMRYVLPSFIIRSSRFIDFGPSSFEIWSPNSNQSPFYAGLRDANFSAGGALPTKLRRSDGHAGRFDPTVSPQYFDANFPWLGFIKRAFNITAVENASILSHWDPTGPGNLGSIDFHFLNDLRVQSTLLQGLIHKRSDIESYHPSVWKNRPILKDNAWQTLRGTISFDEAVDRLAAFQVQLKFMDAWTRYVDALIRKPKPQIDSTLPADESLVGVWINGTSREEGYMLLAYEVPCFIISEINDTQDIERALSQPRAKTFVQDTPILEMSKSGYRIDDTVTKAGGLLREFDQEDFDLGIAEFVPRSLPSDRLLSSPSYQLRTIRGGGKINETSNLTQMVKASSVKENVEELKPPPVRAPEQGKWSIWSHTILEELNFAFCMEYLGANRKNDKGSHCYYDRELRRQLWFDEEVLIPDNYKADPAIFGLPAPNIPYVQYGPMLEILRKPSSNWMYLSERPEQGDLGRTFISVQPSRKDSIPTSVNNENLRTDKATTYRPPTPRPDDQTRRNGKRTYRPEAEETHRSTRGSYRGQSYRPKSRHERWDRPSVRNHYRGNYRDNFEYKNRSRSPYRRYSPYPRRRSPSPTIRPERPNEPAISDTERTRTTRVNNPSTPVHISSLERRLESEDRLEHGKTLDSEERNRNSAESAIITSSPIGTSNALVPYKSLSSVFPDGAQLEAIRAVCPPPEVSPVDTLDCYGGKGHAKTAYLAIWNFPIPFLWRDVIDWIKLVSPLAKNPRILRTVRTNELGNQVFWIHFQTIDEAVYFRGIVTGRRASTTGIRVNCDFVDRTQYNGANGRSKDYWNGSALSGSAGSRSLDEPFSDELCPRSVTSVPLRLRLGMGSVSENPVKLSKNQYRRLKENAKKKLNKVKSADGGAL
ncbi:hypothetical protein BDN70DRAFT_939112 [Pholiota conissans]|uniref:Uncharacterized protein n=1 Tax=Pholiota conissans TaxID=109636 RepID=A0A9P5YJZ3_9AGAR|nr:hypothetical protein BDN70DRAFT_939112 [Pholiota conissans]